MTCLYSLAVPKPVWLNPYLWTGTEMGTILISKVAEVLVLGVEVWRGKVTGFWEQ